MHAMIGTGGGQDEKGRAEFMKRGLKKRTIERYNGNSNLWPLFAGGKGWGADLCMKNASERQKRETIVSFVQWLAVEKGINGDEIARIMSALRSRWVQACADVKIFEDESVELAKRAGRASSTREDHLKKERRRQLPVTMDLIMRERTSHWVNSTDLDKNMTYMGMMLAFNFMWRISEYVMDSRSEEHALRAEDVLFLRRGNPWRTWEVGKAAERGDVKSIVFVIRSTKTGAGRYLYLTGNSEFEAQSIEDVVEWARVSGIGRGDPFLSRWRTGKNGQHQRLKLSRRMMNEALKDLARRSGFEGLEYAFASRSLRIGGATAMIAGGKQRNQVKRTGGWSAQSNVDELYSQFTPADMGALSVPEAQFSVLDADKVRQMLPPTFWDEVSRRG